LAGAVLLAVLAAAARPAAAADCPSLPSQLPRSAPAKQVALSEILGYANEPNSGLENLAVTTEGYLIGVYRLSPTASPCGPTAGAYRLWLATRKPAGMKSVRSRHRAVIAVISAEMVRELVGTPRTLNKMVGKRVRVTGQLTRIPRRHTRLTRGQGSLWQIRSVWEIAPCTRTGCNAVPPVPPRPRPERKGGPT
jgi:hypothetical protein